MVSALQPALLSPPELAARARALTLVLTDCDGVLTDAGVYYSEAGEVLKRFSLRDGMGVERLRDAGIETAIVTRESSRAVAKRAEKLGLPFLFSGVWDKGAHLDAILRESGRQLAQLAYIGDDVNDLGILTKVAAHGLTAAPADAMPAVLAAVHHRCALPGGHGAFRDFAEWILDLRREPPSFTGG
jgi:3-deoxy-D-manno-octulosonate 8-phosphate phosphatase (KDO 8-P phosphatase)